MEFDWNLIAPRPSPPSPVGCQSTSRCEPRQASGQQVNRQDTNLPAAMPCLVLSHSRMARIIPATANGISSHRRISYLSEAPWCMAYQGVAGRLQIRVCSGIPPTSQRISPPGLWLYNPPPLPVFPLHPTAHAGRQGRQGSRQAGAGMQGLGRAGFRHAWLPSLGEGKQGR